MTAPPIRTKGVTASNKVVENICAMWRNQGCGQVVLSSWPSTHWLSTWPHNSRPTKLQRIQKCHQVVIVSPFAFLRNSSARFGDRTGSECLGFHLQVDFV